MDVRRAREIAASPIMADVTYNGERIYIEQVDEQNEMAVVYPLGNPNHKQRVSVSSLHEH
ncbi:small acid-soluble spore, H-type family protein [Anoxybacillus sp. B7M1]|jgi:small acid-soluble spore protein H (minor)|uniref:Small acid-soluble spore protein H n=1 Tax=Anoxybacteroides rupiense TaxID=311460 RepID=A0ABD5IXX5_9BACL|nr:MULTISPECIES: small acid-soluble spore protein H [Anoxybacillus]ANB56112.1 small acid-soluble spore, H-type family protein [Anoxybacillus sp. B2M1]ANB63230.1 small acid-soluble spore, H-type family protein [Anoxybacillus sp. B7M1]KXG10006.1 Small, acid-soluble spore protein H [Anoxybacillus sp. P3H1B]MBB3907664.1 small acid-soluble spore protein H (minor) [Anoxybacillus rupiensis]MBS2771672.1 small acid-soluble spore protein H [Anoxybacillus rupiensis]